MFFNRSIGTRLSLLTMINSSAALILAGSALFVYENVQQREAAIRKVSAQAEIIAANSTGAISFRDETAATNTLRALRGDSYVVQAGIYDAGRHVFARYDRDESGAHVPLPPLPAAGVYRETGALTIVQPVRLGNELLGFVFVKAADDVRGRSIRYVVILCSVISASLMLALWATRRMQRTIAGPITELSAVAKEVSTDRNYSIRATGPSDGEIGILIDSFNHMLSQIHAREELLRESEERYALAARGANDGLWDWKLTKNEIYFSPRWFEMLGHSGSELWSSPDDWFSRIHPSDSERVKAEIAAHCEGLTEEFVSEYRIRHNNGTFIWILSRGMAVRDSAGTALRIAGSQTDITEGKIVDPLTGLPNRLYFLDRLESALEAAARTGGVVAALFLDLDRFKLVNDSLGHAAGDALLIEIAARLRSAAAHTVSPSELQMDCVVARIGGDEFAILVCGSNTLAAAKEVADRVLRTVNAPVQLTGRRVFPGVSIGIAVGSSAVTADDLLRNADTAMYHAKTGGKGRVEIFDENMRARALARLEVEAGLRRAIEAEELVLFYQPKFSTDTNRLTGYEALIRWNHPERGILGPGEFIPVAEESDMIIGVGRWVMAKACRQMADWHRSGLADPGLTISVNVSAKQLNDSCFVQDVERILAQTGLSPECLKLEVTESSIIDDPEAALARLLELKKLNVGLEIDDFGTGYSSLSYLQRLPFDTVKIDASFVKELGRSAESNEIVDTILKLARSLHMEVVAEGVENADQLNMLSTLGCQFAQGFYFSKPVTAEITEASLRRRAELQLSAALPPAFRKTAKARRNETDFLTDGEHESEYSCLTAQAG